MSRGSQSNTTPPYVGPLTFPILFEYMVSTKLYPRDIGKKKIEYTWKANQRPVTSKVAMMMIVRI